MKERREAADALTQAEAEIERLRAALRPLAALPIGDATPDVVPLYGLDGFYITHGDIRRAKALSDKEAGDD
jgi:hypothetical protein